MHWRCLGAVGWLAVALAGDHAPAAEPAAPWPLAPLVDHARDALSAIENEFVSFAGQVSAALTNRPEAIAAWTCSLLDRHEILLLDGSGAVRARHAAGVPWGGGWPVALNEQFLAAPDTDAGASIRFLLLETGGETEGWLMAGLADAGDMTQERLALRFPLSNLLEIDLGERAPHSPTRWMVVNRAGQAVYRPVSPEAALVALHPRTRAEMERRDSGARRVTLLEGDPPDLISLELNWAELFAGKPEWRVVSEQRRAFTADPEHPLSGRWVGALTSVEKRRAEETGVVNEERSGGALNVILLQDGSACTLRIYGPAGVSSAAGTTAGTTFSAADVRPRNGERPEVWYWVGNYDPERDAITGTIYGDAREAVVTQSFFLRREPGPTGGPSS
jgi:hypothetical protein